MKDYEIYPHAVDRAVERLGFERNSAGYRLKQLMQTAQYQGDSYSKKHGDCRVYDHYKTRVRLVYSIKKDWIVTVYNLNDPLASISATGELPDLLLAAVKREASKLLRGHSRQLRKLEREVAEAEVELAQKRLNRIKTNNPRTKLAIDRDIAVISGLINDSKADMDAVNADISQLTPHAPV